MYLCYVDESGTSSVPGNTSHFVLCGLSIPDQYWKDCDKDIETIKSRYGILDQEIHTAWILRKYLEQSRISGFESLSWSQRRYQVTAFRNTEILRLQHAGNSKLKKQTEKNYKETSRYIHLSYTERRNLILDIARLLSGWGFARLFAECVNKIHFDPSRAQKTIDEQAFEQVVSRFEQYLQAISAGLGHKSSLGMLIYDNNDTVARKHTDMMKKFHRAGTLWTNVSNIIETPLFVNSEFTSMVQLADVCSYAIRRYLENGEEELFDLVFKRADRRGETVVGVRHFTSPSCACKICVAHRRPVETTSPITHA